LFGVELNEDNHRNCKQTGVKREERESRHLGKKELALKHDGIVKYIWSRGEGSVRVRSCPFLIQTLHQFHTTLGYVLLLTGGNVDVDEEGVYSPLQKA